MDTFDEIQLMNISRPFEFWALMEELNDTNDDRIKYYRDKLISEFVNPSYYKTKIYGLILIKNHDKYDKNIFCEMSEYYSLFPCFCMINKKGKAEIMWTHPRARKNGFAKKLIDLLEIKYVENPHTDSIEFWKKCNIEIINNNFQSS